MLAGLRGIDEDIWKAARIDGLPAWRVYLSIVTPMLGASFATAGVFVIDQRVRLYDLSVSMTNGGPASPRRCRQNSSWITFSNGP